MKICDRNINTCIFWIFFSNNFILYEEKVTNIHNKSGRLFGWLGLFGMVMSKTFSGGRYFHVEARVSPALPLPPFPHRYCPNCVMMLSLLHS